MANDAERCDLHVLVGNELETLTEVVLVLGYLTVIACGAAA